VFFLRICCVLLAVRQVIQDVEVTVDVDAMILLDVSGSVGNPNWNKEVDVAKKVMDTLRDEVDNDHKKVGYVAWDSKVEDAEGLTDLVATPTNAGAWPIILHLVAGVPVPAFVVHELSVEVFTMHVRRILEEGYFQVALCFQIHWRSVRINC
jgi:hypothetical protein